MSTQIELIATKTQNKQQWDIGSICEQIDITWSLEGNAGSMDISCIPDNNLQLEEGDIISLKLDGKQFFYGWIFKVTKSAYESIKLKVYDIKRYLAFKDVDVTGGETLDQCFARICKMKNYPYTILDTSTYRIPNKIHDGETYNNILQYAIDQTFIATGKRFAIRANGPKLELIECSKQLIDTVIGDKSLLTDYEFSSDIENTYTAFKLQRELSSEQQKNISEAQKIIGRKTLTFDHAENIKKWGVLQYYEKKDSKWTDAQLQQHLLLLRNAYGRKTRTLRVECIGDIECIPGNMVTLFISDLEKENVAQRTYSLITEAKHTITHSEHHMSLDVEIA